MVLALVATGAIGGSLLGLSTFAHGSCRSTDRTYRVGWGDNLSSIAGRYGTSYWTIARYNGISNPNYIYVAELLCIPSGRSTPVGGGGGGYTGGIPVASQNYYVGLAQQDAYNTGIPANLFVRQIYAESGFRTNAYSGAGAIGIAQFMPGTAASLGINPYNPVQSLWGASRLMSSYYHQYGSYAMALAAYNAGPGTVNYAIRGCGGYWTYCLPSETQNYIRIIMY
ncbi:MAG: lytic transglycosylase domain-containing protein [Ktedonobacteraceae bacterium]